MSSKRNQSSKIRMLVTLAMMIAMEVVLSRLLTIWVSQNLKLTLNFIPIAVSAYLFGPWAAVAVAGIGDLIGSFIFPVGAYYYGFTVTAILTGIAFGLFLNRKYSLLRIILCVFSIQIVLTVFLDSFWFNQFYHTDYWVNVAARAVKAGIMVVVECVLLNILLPLVKKVNKSIRI